MPRRSSTWTSSQPKHSLVTLKLSSTAQRCRYMAKMRSACCSSSTGQSGSREVDYPGLLLGACLLAPLHLQTRFRTGYGPQLPTGLGNVPLLPLSRMVLELHPAIGMVEPTHHMILILPNGVPHRNIVKATVENPGDPLARSKLCDGLAHRL